MDTLEWLGVWEDLEAPGKHTARIPADGAAGYRYRSSCYGSKGPEPRPAYTMWDRVNRAIPVDGTVRETPPSWMRSPQARIWLEKENPPILERIRVWLRRPCTTTSL